MDLLFLVSLIHTAYHYRKVDQRNKFIVYIVVFFVFLFVFPRFRVAFPAVRLPGADGPSTGNSHHWSRQALPQPAPRLQPPRRSHPASLSHLLCCNQPVRLPWDGWHPVTPQHASAVGSDKLQDLQPPATSVVEYPISLTPASEIRTPPWLLPPSTPPWPVITPAPPGCLVSPARHWSICDHSPGLQSSNYALSLCPYGSVSLLLSSGSTYNIGRSGSAVVFWVPASASVA